VSEVARRYVAAFATNDPAGVEQMVQLSEPGSPARAYAEFRVAQFRAVEAAGLEFGEQQMSVSGDAIKVCLEAECARFSDFVAHAGSRRLVEFSIDGEPVRDRIVSLDDRPAVSVFGASIRPVGALRQNSDGAGLRVAVEVTAGEAPINVFLYSSRYVDPGGRQVATQPRRTTGESDVRPGATSYVLLFFPNVRAGGILYLPVDGGDTSQEVSLRI
jgi:hypothetical protein